jgi:hypothetical protein
MKTRLTAKKLSRAGGVIRNAMQTRTRTRRQMK